MLHVLKHLNCQVKICRHLQNLHVLKHINCQVKLYLHLQNLTRTKTHQVPSEDIPPLSKLARNETLPLPIGESSQNISLLSEQQSSRKYINQMKDMIQNSFE